MVPEQADSFHALPRKGPTILRYSFLRSALLNLFSTCKHSTTSKRFNDIFFNILTGLTILQPPQDPRPYLI